MLRKGTIVRSRPKNVQPLKEKLFIGALGVNCLQYTRNCIKSVRTECEEVRFVYIDNGSKEENCAEIKKWKKQNPDIDVFNVAFNGYNAGVAPGWNQLIKVALEWGATKIIICNNDITFGPHTIDGLCKAYDQLRKHVPETVMVTATNHTKRPEQLASIKQVWKHQEHPDFSCFMITPETIERIGFFTEHYKPAFFEDNDTHWRILLSGYKAFSTDWAPYSHIASRTRYENHDIVPHKRFRENKLVFFRYMLTDTVGQEVPDERYAKWLEAHPDQPHPAWQDVNEWCVEQGIITSQMIRWLDKATIYEQKLA